VIADGQFDYYIRVNWPGNAPLTEAYLSFDPVDNSALEEFIIANTPSEHRIYFVVGSPLQNEHENMKQKLKAKGEFFFERVEHVGEATVGFFKRRKVPQRDWWIFGSTTSRDTIAAIFENYISWDAFSWSFLFIISKEEPPYWKTSPETFFSFKSEETEETMHPELIRQSHCVLLTVHEAGIAIASDKLSREGLIEIATEIAKRSSTELSVESYSRSSVGKASS